MTALPAAYSWLATEPARPRMIDEALKLYGTIEGAGALDNPVIMNWAKELGLDAMYSHDAIPWCGLFVGIVAKRAGKTIPGSPLWALSWARFGRGLKPGEVASLGDVLVFKRDGGGHVALYVGEDASAFHVLGGNQHDQVNIMRIAKARLHAARRPLYQVQPAGVRPHHLGASGALSTNEA